MSIALRRGGLVMVLCVVLLGVCCASALAAAPQAPETGPASVVTATSASVGGTLNPHAPGEPGVYYFVYAARGAACTEGGSSVEAVTPGFEKEPVTPLELTGLEPDTSYAYCLVDRSELSGESTVGSSQTLTTLAVKPTVEGESASVVHSSGATLQAQVNANNQATTYSFQYATSETFTGAVTILGNTIEGYGAQTVSATIPPGTLKVSTTYYYRVVAENATGTIEGAVQPFTTLPATRIDSEFAIEVSATSATIQAQINPLDTDTTYYFQYGTSSCTTTPEVCTSVPTPPGQDIGSAEVDQQASVHIQGLQPNTTYYYRVVATNSAGGSPASIDGEDHTFTTQAVGAPFALPDGRQYELVSPPDKHGTEVLKVNGYSGGGVVQASEDGGSITYVTYEPPELAARANGFGNQLLSSRGGAGWVTRNITLPHSAPVGVPVGSGTEYKAFSSDLASGLAMNGFGGEKLGHPVEDTPLPGSEAPAGYQNYYLHNNENGSVDALLKLPFSVKEPAEIFEMELMTASPDLKHIVVATKAALTPGMPNETEAKNIYEWTAGKFEPISLYPDGSPQLTGHSMLGYNGNSSLPISNDGSRVVWTEGLDLYMRENIGTPQARTVFIAGGENGPFFRLESSDGSRVYYTLIDGASENLYEFNTETGDSNLIAKAVAGVVGASRDGSYLYYVDNDDRLFLWHEGEPPHMIAALSSGDEQAGVIGSNVAADWSNNLSFRTARVTPDGKHLVFMSENSLTGYDNIDSTGGSCVSLEGSPLSARCEEVFIYDAPSEHLTCVSCNSTGARPIGGSDISGGTKYELTGTLYDSRVLSESGRRVFFDSADAILPGDTNGVGDVYEWEEAGEGNCAREGGCVSLISSGKGSAESSFLDASVSGNDVFFLTHDKLVGADLDNVGDVYDAHVCSESAPCLPVAPVVPAPCDTGDGCRPSPSPQPLVFGAPASATFSGAGNVVASSPVTVVVKKVKHKAAKKRKRKRKGKAGRVVRNANGSRGTRRSSARKGR